jgi:hypothetical protein
MSDLVERLRRAWNDGWEEDANLYAEAADEIEKLRGVIKFINEVDAQRLIDREQEVK